MVHLYTHSPHPHPWPGHSFPDSVPVHTRRHLLYFLRPIVYPYTLAWPTEDDAASVRRYTGTLRV